MRPRVVLSTLSAALALGSLALGSLAACGKPATTTPPDTTTTSGTSTLGGSPAGTTGAPSTGGPPTAGPTTAAPPVVPTPHSTLASKAGFVWVYNSSSSYASASVYQYNSAGGGINITHISTGRYQVTFVGLGGTGGVAHVQAYGGSANYCAVDYWSGGTNVSVTASCYNPTGNYADTTFVANWAAGSQGSAHFAYLWAEQETNTGTYHPSSSYRYDAIKSANLTVTRLSTGRYEVYLPAAGPDLPDPWGFQITAYGSRNLCKLQSFTVSTKKAVVACRTPLGSSVDTKFSLSFYSEGSLIGRTDRRYGDSGTGYSGVANPSTGHYTATFNEMGQNKGQVVSIATGAGSTYCHVAGWTASGADLTATTVCFNPGGVSASSNFLASATW